MSVRLRKRKLKSGKIQYFLDIYLNGKRQRESLALFLGTDRARNAEIQRLAEAIRAKRELQVHAGEHDIEFTQRDKIGFCDFAESVYRNKLPRTAQPYRSAILEFQTYAGKQVLFSQLSPQICEGFKKHLISRFKTATAGAYFARFKSVLNQAIKQRILSRSPAEGISIPKADSLPKYLTLEELQILAKTPCGNQAVRDAFFFSCLTGLRFEDVDSLTWEKIRGDAIEFTQLKTNCSERIPLAADALTLLIKQRDAQKGPKVKRNHSSQSVFKLPAQQTVDKVLKSWSKRAGFERRLSFHKARHTFATLALSYGVDIYTTSRLLGHKSIMTTSIYARVVDEKKREAVSKLPSIF